MSLLIDSMAEEASDCSGGEESQAQQARVSDFFRPQGAPMPLQDFVVESGEGEGGGG